MRILIIEDEHRLSDSIRDYLQSQNYTCDQAFDFDDAMVKSGVNSYDCVLLDLMLPGGDGLDILRRLRSRHNSTGVIIISAKDSLDDRLEGLKIGADDYLPKPFALSELSMRIFALIRRKQFAADNVVSSGRISVNLLEKTVSVGGEPVELTRSEYELLVFFIGNRKRVLSKAAIAEHLSGEMADMMDNYDFVYAHIKNLKQKLAKAGEKDRITTIYGTGYRWTDE